MKRKPKISAGQINRGLCGIRGCGTPVSKKTHVLKIKGERIPVCVEHYETAHDDDKIGGVKKKGVSS